MSHLPVMLVEVLAGLAVKADGTYLDCTFGRGGHTRAILNALGSKGRVLALDRDPEAIIQGEKLMQDDARLKVRHCNFGDLASSTEACDAFIPFDGVLLDLGVSSPQLNEAKRGFGFLNDGPLDMRMNPDDGLSAAQWVSDASETEMTTVFKSLGEERYAKRIAHAIVERRKIEPFEKTLDLASVISEANPAWQRHKHPATRVFQAIRMHVNRELDELELVLAPALNLLAVGGRLAVISFHSLEDRRVKHFLKKQMVGETLNLPRDWPVQPPRFEPRVRYVTKACHASEDEVKSNPRSRSAVLRVVEKVR